MAEFVQCDALQIDLDLKRIGVAGRQVPPDRDGGGRDLAARPARGHAVAGVPLPGAAPYAVPADSYFVLGDNREDSHDSRFWGAVPHANIKGTAIYIWFSAGSGKTRWGRVGQTIR